MTRNWPCNMNERHQEKDDAFKALPTFQLMFIFLTSEPHQPIRCAGQILVPWAPRTFMAPFIVSHCLLFSVVGLGFGVHTYRFFPLLAMTII